MGSKNVVDGHFLIIYTMLTRRKLWSSLLVFWNSTKTSLRLCEINFLLMPSAPSFIVCTISLAFLSSAIVIKYNDLRAYSPSMKLAIWGTFVMCEARKLFYRQPSIFWGAFVHHYSENESKSQTLSIISSFSCLKRRKSTQESTTQKKDRRKKLWDC